MTKPLKFYISSFFLFTFILLCGQSSVWPAAATVQIQKQKQQQALYAKKTQEEMKRKYIEEMKKREAAGGDIPMDVESALQEKMEPELPLPAADEIKSSIERVMRSTTNWDYVDHQGVREIITGYALNELEDEGFMIEKSETHYAALVSAMLKEKPELYDVPFKEVVKMAAIIENDLQTSSTTSDA